MDEKVFSLENYGVDIPGISYEIPPAPVRVPNRRMSVLGNAVWEEYLKFLEVGGEQWLKIPLHNKRDANRLRNLVITAGKRHRAKLSTRVRVSDKVYLWVTRIE